MCCKFRQFTFLYENFYRDDDYYNRGNDCGNHDSGLFKRTQLFCDEIGVAVIVDVIFYVAKHQRGFVVNGLVLFEKRHNVALFPNVRVFVNGLSACQTCVSIGV